MYRIIGADGRDYGPVGADELRQWIAEGRANAQSQVLVEGTLEWRALGTFPEFAADLASTASRTPAAFPVTTMGSGASAKTNGMAIAGLVLGIMSIPSFCCCCLNLPCAILGLIFSCIGLSQINRNPMQGGRGLAIAGIILSVLGLLLMGMWMIFSSAHNTFDPSIFQ
jgi:hypothetical protein